jgi:hypothetical protein
VVLVLVHERRAVLLVPTVAGVEGRRRGLGLDGVTGDMASGRLGKTQVGGAAWWKGCATRVRIHGPT